MKHQTKDFKHLIGSLKGISNKQVEAHLGLYEGYVKKLNEIETKLKDADPSGANYSFNEYSELKRREAVAFNGAYLHQYYFENLNSNPGKKDPQLVKVIEESFGSVENWEKDLKSSALSTPGWVVTTKNKRDNTIHNYILFEHHLGLPVDQEIIMALDCWEHAFMIDYGTNKADYLKSFLENVDWSIVSKRFLSQ